MQDTKQLSGMMRYPAAARFLGISPLTLRRYVMDRKVPFYKPFGNGKTPVLFDPEDLGAFVRKARVEPITASA
jgi:hypothetical protein